MHFQLKEMGYFDCEWIVLPRCFASNANPSHDDFKSGSTLAKPSTFSFAYITIYAELHRQPPQIDINYYYLVVCMETQFIELKFAILRVYL